MKVNDTECNFLTAQCLACSWEAILLPWPASSLKYWAWHHMVSNIPFVWLVWVSLLAVSPRRFLWKLTLSQLNPGHSPRFLLLFGTTDSYRSVDKGPIWHVCMIRWNTTIRCHGARQKVLLLFGQLSCIIFPQISQTGCSSITQLFLLLFFGVVVMWSLTEIFLGKPVSLLPLTSPDTSQNKVADLANHSSSKCNPDTVLQLSYWWNRQGSELQPKTRCQYGNCSMISFCSIWHSVADVRLIFMDEWFA